jgi:hypothetical protein
VVLTGPPGAGKTSALIALHDLLVDEGIRHAAFEVEALAWASPAVSDEASFRHVAAIRALFVEEGYDLLLCGATVTSDAYLGGLTSAIGSVERLVVRLDASESTLVSRIEAREPPGWSGLERLLGLAAEIAEGSRRLQGIDLSYSTDELTAEAVAARLRAALAARGL